MHSIIDEITETENQAAKIKQDAKIAAKEAVASAQEEKERKNASQAELSRIKLREATQKAEAEGESAAKDILAERTEKTKEISEAAAKKMPEAVKYLVGRVVS